MQQKGQALQWWVLGSAVLMVVGAFGPWVKALGQSVSGTDGSNDGWFVVAAAVIGGLLFYANRAHRAAGVWALLGGIAGVGITLYDRSNVQNAIDKGGAFAQALVQIGWGLNLALAASASMAVAAAVHWVTLRAQEQLLLPPASSPPLVATTPTSPAPPSPAPPPTSAPTPPPD
jgi:hypothetical protein